MSSFSSLVSGSAFLGAIAVSQAAFAGHSDPHPVASYEEAIGRIEHRRQLDDSIAISSGRSILMTHGHRTARAFVLLHGFTDSPSQFAALGRRLFDRGDNVLIPRLPHHAERSDALHALSKVRASQLASFGDSVVDEAVGLGDSVIVVGLSAGGAITGHIAQYRDDVSRVVLVAPAIASEYLEDDTGEQLLHAAARLPEVRRESAPDTSAENLRQGITTRGLAQVLRLGAEVRADAAEKPAHVKRIFFLLNENDRTVSRAAAFAVALSWSTNGASVWVYTFPKTNNLPHNLLADEAHKGNTALVYPVLEALAVGSEVPATVRKEKMQCNTWRCRLAKIRPRF